MDAKGRHGQSVANLHIIEFLAVRFVLCSNNQIILKLRIYESCFHEFQSTAKCFVCDKIKSCNYRISANSCRDNYSFFELLVRQLFKGDNYSREETIVFQSFGRLVKLLLSAILNIKSTPSHILNPKTFESLQNTYLHTQLHFLKNIPTYLISMKLRKYI